ncbi:MAG: M48 family metallopeptidase [Nitrososphaerales archaeon]
MSYSETFTIDTEVVPTEFGDLLKFIYYYYLLPKQEFFSNIRKIIFNQENLLSFTYTPEKRLHIDVEIKAGRPILVRVTSVDEMPRTIINRLKENLFINVQLFEEKVRRTTLYFAWVKGEEMTPEKLPTTRKRATDRLFTETMLLFYIILIGASIFLFFIIGFYAIIFVVIFQLIAVLLSDRIMAKLGGWRIDLKNHFVYLFQYHMPVEEYKEFLSKYGKDTALKMKREIYERSIALDKNPDCNLGEEVFSKYGIKCEPERMSAKTINIYGIVKKATEKFGLPVPKMVISNTMVPNAAATGPSPSHGTVVITTGLLVQLEEDEILSIIGHELGHLKGRDPLILFGIISTEYLLRIFVFLDIFLLFPLLYLILAMGIIYFIAKFFEARADLLSAMRLGQPQVLAEALRKIGFRRLQFERTPTRRVQSWLGLNPHPPIYFRVDRLRRLDNPERVKHPLFQSIKDVINGFRSALRAT